MNLRLALAQWRIGEPHRFEDYANRIIAALDHTGRAGAALAVLPEYAALELAAIFPREVREDFVRSLDVLQALHEPWLALFAAEARRRAQYVLAGSFLLRMADGRYRNRAYLFGPDGGWVWQDKLTLTGFERAAGVMEPGDALAVFETALGRLGIVVCYDSEFPFYGRRQVEAGARLLLVPSCTDTVAGATRVRIGCQARALENQVYVAQSVTAGAAAWSPALDLNTGNAAVYAPSDRGLPPDGVVACAIEGDEWLITDIDFDLLDRVRVEGQVANAVDWDGQQRPPIVRAQVRKL